MRKLISKVRSHDRDKENDAVQQQATPPDSQDDLEPEEMAIVEEEKHSIAQWEEQKRPLEPDEITIDPSRKVVGHSSKHLRCSDFELLKTVGTGMGILAPCGLSGSFTAVA